MEYKGHESGFKFEQRRNITEISLLNSWSILSTDNYSIYYYNYFLKLLYLIRPRWIFLLMPTFPFKASAASSASRTEPIFIKA